MTKTHVTPHFDHLDLRYVMVQLTTMCMMPMLVPVVSHDQKGHVTPHFDHLDLRNAAVPLMMLSTRHAADTKAVAPYDMNTNAKGIMLCQ